MADYFLKDLKKDVAEKLDYTQDSVENILRTAFDIIGNKVAIDGDKVYLIDFLNLEPKDYAAKQAKNPQTGEPMVIAPYRTILCKPTKAMKRKLKSKFEK
ncbi:HU family DNA-binding protein [Bacillus tequilensis]|uniref:HU family DNA-binding protein n=1 Tax=Bacillus tequilensis TaxID=227866 RepID=UPI000467B85D|nr:HU family DNA-binding protein [Bacillus tequilensis]MDR4436133.1 HU family DNA-binding protein [Bacillus tequilensis]SPT93237.1 histone family protein DNA-binding protein [Bacillus tequilensis]